MTAPVIAVRTLHALISLWFVSCLLYVYYAAFARKRDRMLAVATVALIGEGAVVGLNGGDCPLGAVHHRYGDDKAFFELILPKSAAKAAVPVLGGVSALGFSARYRPAAKAQLRLDSTSPAAPISLHNR